MKRIMLVASLVLCAAVSGGENELWCDRKAAAWEERCPVGNGWVGAMVDVDSLQLNHYCAGQG